MNNNNKQDISNKKVNRALLIINLQRDYCLGGPMAIDGSLDIIPPINRIKKKFDVVIFSKNWHPENHKSFKKYGGNYEPHCVQYTKGASIFSTVCVDKNKDYYIRKGTDTNYSSSSAFYKSEENKIQTNLKSILDSNEVEELYICGLALENSVFSTVIDAKKFRYKCYIIKDATATRDKKSADMCYEFFKNNMISCIYSDDIK